MKTRIEFLNDQELNEAYCGDYFDYLIDTLESNWSDYEIHQKTLIFYNEDLDYDILAINKDGIINEETISIGHTVIDNLRESNYRSSVSENEFHGVSNFDF